jgi:hypothetical protein
MGYALCIDHLINTSENHSLCFVPYKPRMDFTVDVAWKKHQVFSRASTKFLERLQQEIKER